jgi:hypothetical protein
MKTNFLKSMFLFALAAIVMLPALQSCKSSQKVAVPAGETALTMYCSGDEYSSDSEYFRANNTGESPNQNMAKRKAMSNARLDLAQAIETHLKSVTDNYLIEHTSGQDMEFKQRMETLSREVVNQKLNGIRTICEQFTQTTSGNYKCYVAIELAGEELLNGMKNRIPEDDKLRIDFQYEKFKEEFNKEMEQFKSR